MKKILRILLVIFIILIAIVITDIYFIFNFNKPLIVLKKEMPDNYNKVYRGIFYDTYDCVENSIAQIKSKGTKYSCHVILNNN